MRALARLDWLTPIVLALAVIGGIALAGHHTAVAIVLLVVGLLAIAAPVTVRLLHGDRRA